jgi:Domain of unknown function (DUF5925)/ATPase family associated with various cellular activities (AAA)
MHISTNNTQDAVLRPSGMPRRRIAGAWAGAVPRGLFISELLERRLAHVARDEFHGVALPDSLAALGAPVLVRADPAGDEVEALLQLPGGALALVDGDHAQVSIEVAAASRDEAERALAGLRAALASKPSAVDRVPVAFWMQGDRGGDLRHRDIEAPRFEAIEGNYPAAVRTALAVLMELRAPERGRLILWRGEPGTGKSHALRALVRSWAPWCSAHFIVDPEQLFGHAGAYMLDVLTWDGDDGDRWRLMILEDAGELITADARSLAGQALSRLLNVADGLLGQGTRTLVLITTNEPVRRLHPATRRAGRCLADVEFAPLSVAEANAWIARHGHDRRVEQPTALADLYSHVEPAPVETTEGAPAAFGFARGLAAEDGAPQAR